MGTRLLSGQQGAAASTAVLRLRRVGPVEIVDWTPDLTRARADYYRERSARLRQMAEEEPIVRFRNSLLDIAAEYEKLSEKILTI